MKNFLTTLITLLTRFTAVSSFGGSIFATARLTTSLWNCQQNVSSNITKNGELLTNNVCIELAMESAKSSAIEGAIITGILAGALPYFMYKWGWFANSEYVIRAKNGKDLRKQVGDGF